MTISCDKCKKEICTIEFNEYERKKQHLGMSQYTERKILETIKDNEGSVWNLHVKDSMSTKYFCTKCYARIWDKFRDYTGSHADWWKSI